LRHAERGNLWRDAFVITQRAESLYSFEKNKVMSKVKGKSKNALTRIIDFYFFLFTFYFFLFTLYFSLLYAGMGLVD